MSAPPGVFAQADAAIAPDEVPDASGQRKIARPGCPKMPFHFLKETFAFSPTGAHLIKWTHPKGGLARICKAAFVVRILVKLRPDIDKIFQIMV